MLSLIGLAVNLVYVNHRITNSIPRPYHKHCYIYFILRLISPSALAIYLKDLLENWNCKKDAIVNNVGFPEEKINSGLHHVFMH